MRFWARKRPRQYLSTTPKRGERQRITMDPQIDYMDATVEEIAANVDNGNWTDACEQIEGLAPAGILLFALTSGLSERDLHTLQNMLFDRHMTRQGA